MIPSDTISRLSKEDGLCSLPAARSRLPSSSLALVWVGLFGEDFFHRKLLKGDLDRERSFLRPRVAPAVSLVLCLGAGTHTTLTTKQRHDTTLRMLHAHACAHWQAITINTLNTQPHVAIHFNVAFVWKCQQKISFRLKKRIVCDFKIRETPSLYEGGFITFCHLLNKQSMLISNYLVY